MYLLWDGYRESTENEAYKEKREKAYEPASDFVDMPITGITGKNLKFFYFIISRKPQKLEPKTGYQ